MKVTLVTEEIKEMQQNSIYLDGAVRGTVIDNVNNSYSFDHHGDSLRFSTVSACKQMFSAIVQGLDLSTIDNVFVSSIDADSVISTWLCLSARHSIRSDIRFQRFIDVIDRVDCHGSAALLIGESVPSVCFSLTANKKAGESETTELLLQKVDLFDKLFNDGTYDATSSMPSRAGIAVAFIGTDYTVIESDNVSFGTIYSNNSGFGIISANGSYTIGKLPFAKVPSFKTLFPLLNQIETAGSWGGADSIGGSPMGKQSSLNLQQVIDTVIGWLGNL